MLQNLVATSLACIASEFVVMIGCPLDKPK